MPPKVIPFILDGYPGNDLYIKRTDHYQLEARCNLQLESGLIFLYGDSKNGKTSLINHIFDGKNPINILCPSLTSIADIYRQIYRELGLNDCEIENEGGFNLWGILGKKRVTKKQTYPLDINGVINHMVEKNRKYLILDDIHYLQESIQKELAIALKSFSGKGIKVALIGVKGRIKKDIFFEFNPDLKGRLEYIEVERMSRDIIDLLLRKLLAVLKLSLDNPAINHIINRVERQPYMVVKAVHILNDVISTKKNPAKKLSKKDVQSILDSYDFPK